MGFWGATRPTGPRCCEAGGSAERGKGTGGLRSRLLSAGLAAACVLALGACGAGGTRTHSTTSTDRSGSDGADGLVNVQSITYRSSFDGGRVTALVAVPRGGASRGCLIWQYGLGSTQQDTSKVWQDIAPLGLSTVSIDFRYHGARASSPTELEQVIRDPNSIAEMIRGTVADLRSLVAYLETQSYCWRNVVYAGIGLGGTVGTILAATDDQVKAAVIMSTPATFRALLTTPGGEILPGIARDPAKLAAALRILSPLDPARFIGRISPRPVLILSGVEDKTVPISDARELGAAAREPKTIVDYAGGHDPTTGAAASSNGQAVESFLLRHVVEPTYGIAANANGTFTTQ